MLSNNLWKKYRIVAIHCLAWLIFIFFGTINRVSRNPDFKIDLIDIFFTQLASVYVFYGSNMVFFRFLAPKRYTMLVVSESIFFLSYLVLTYVDGYWIAPLINPQEMPPPFHPDSFLIQGLWVFFLYSYFSFGYFYAVQTIRREKELGIAEAKKLQAERDTLIAEYSFLRSQINPHFLHNTLNFFYAKSLDTSHELSEGILTLSELMRYSLEDGDAQNGKVLLAREVDNLKKVIKINQLRFSNKLHVDLSVDGNFESIRIIPLILVTLLENAFKHGELTNPQHPIRIRIEVDEQADRFVFFIVNRKKHGPKEFGHGIGLDNVKKRLKYAYKENHQLTVKDEKESYAVELVIMLKEEDHRVAI